jgi:hypothetical protein
MNAKPELPKTKLRGADRRPGGHRLEYFYEQFWGVTATKRFGRGYFAVLRRVSGSFAKMQNNPVQV